MIVVRKFDFATPKEAGRGRPALPKRKTTFQTNTCPQKFICGQMMASVHTCSTKDRYGQSTVTVRASIWVFVFVCFRFYCRGFIDFARNDIVFVCFYTAGGLRPTFNTAEREKSYIFCEAIFDENFKRLPHSRDKFRCSARQTRRKSPDSTTGTAGDLRPMFNTAEREKSYVFLARRFLMKILNACLTAEISFDAPQGKRGENRPTVLRVRQAI